MPVINCNN